MHVCKQYGKSLRVMHLSAFIIVVIRCCFLIIIGVVIVIIIIIKVNAPEWWLIVIGVVAATVNGSVFPVYSILFGEVLRVFQMPKEDVLDEINVWAILFLALAFGSGIAIFFKVSKCLLFLF